MNDCRRFIKNLSFNKDGELVNENILMLDEELYNEESKFDGYYCIATNLQDNVKTIININHNRWQIEESFRIMKTELDSGTVYLQREDRIKAHFMICFLALTIYRYLEKKLDYKYTTSQILNTLRTMNVLESKGDGYIPEYIRTNLTDDLHNVFDFRTDYEINTYKDFKKIFDSLN